MLLFGVSMPSGSIQAIPRKGVKVRIVHYPKFQCHLVRFKLFRECIVDALNDPRSRFNAIWFDSSYSAP